METNLTLNIEIDTCPLNPRKEYGTVGTLFQHGTNRYLIGDIMCSEDTFWRLHVGVPDGVLDYADRHHFFRYLTVHQDRGEYFIFSIFAHIHGGITIALSSFNDPWDSDKIGHYLITRDDLLAAGFSETDDLHTIAEQCARAEIEVFDAYLRGQLYGYIISSPKDDHLESCWGFYSESEAQSEGENALAYLADQQEQEYFATFDALLENAR